MKADEPRQNRIPFMMSDSELERVDEWRFANKIGTRAEAIRRLCHIALTLEPLVAENHRLWTAVHKATLRVNGSTLDAWSNIDTKGTEENLREIDDAVSELDAASLEFMVHSQLLATIFGADSAGQTIQESIDDMRQRISFMEDTRRFVRETWGDKK